MIEGDFGKSISEARDLSTLFGHNPAEESKMLTAVVLHVDVHRTLLAL